MRNFHRSSILFLTQVFPYPLTSGARIRAYYLLRHLAQYHQITLVSFVRDDDQPESIEHLRQFCTAVHTVPMRRSLVKNLWAALESVVTGRPIAIARDRLPAMEALLRQLVSENDSFDFVHADQTSMAYYALFAHSLCTSDPSPLTLLDQHNAMYLLIQRQANYETGWQKLLWQREAELFARYEAGLCRHFNHILTVTEEDKSALLRLLPDGQADVLRHHFTVLPICVDPAEQPTITRPNQEPRILHLGTMFWPPNVEGVLWFAREVLPRIIEQLPDTRFTVVGKNPPDEVYSLAHARSPLADHIDVTGYIADPTPILEQSQVFIVPVRAGGGMRVKILDGWLWGLPIVSTTIGAEGISCRHGENILLADEPAEFAQAVVRILTEPDLAKSLSDNGRQWVTEHYNWHTVYTRLDSIYARFPSKC